MKEFNFTKYEDAIKIYREKNLMQALYDEGEIIMDQVLVCLHGDDHRKRRKVENKVFSRETFRLYETDIYPVTLDQTIQPFLKKGKMDLVDFGFRVLLNLTADFSGVDRPEKSPEETETLLKLLKIFASGATLAHSTRDRDEVKEEIKVALKEFENKFLGPSIKRREELIKNANENELPTGVLLNRQDILTALLNNQEELQLPYDVLMREIAFYLLAGAQTSIHSLVHTFHEIMQWVEKNPDKKKIYMIQYLFKKQFMKAQDFIHQAQLLGENQHVRFIFQIMKRQRKEIRLLLIYIPVIGMRKCLAKMLKNSIQIGRLQVDKMYMVYLLDWACTPALVEILQQV